MVIKRTKSTVKHKVVDTMSSGNTVPGKQSSLKARSGLHMLLLADKQVQEDRTLLTSPPGSVLLTPTKTVPFSSVLGKKASVRQSEMSNSALLQLAEMCTNELESGTIDKPSPTLSVPTSDQSHTKSTPDSESASPPEKRTCHWNLLRDAVGLYSSSEASNHEEKLDTRNRKRIVHNILSVQSTHAPMVACTTIPQTHSSDDKFSTLAELRSFTRDRKLSSSATESVPSPSSSFDGEQDEFDLPVFSSNLEPESLRILSGRNFHQTNDHFSQNLDTSSKVIPNIDCYKALNIHNVDQYQQSPSDQHIFHQNKPLAHQQLRQHLRESPDTDSKSLFWKRVDTSISASTSTNKQYLPFSQQNLHVPTKTVVPNVHDIDPKLLVKAENNEPSHQNLRGSLSSYKMFGETRSAFSEPQSLLSKMSEDTSHFVKMNFPERRQQHCIDLSKTSCDKTPTTHSYSLHPSYTPCQGTFTKNSSLFSDSKLASLLTKAHSHNDSPIGLYKTDSRVDNSMNLFKTESHKNGSILVSSVLDIRKVNEQSKQHFDTTSLSSGIQSGVLKPNDSNIPDFKVPSNYKSMENKPQFFPSISSHTIHEALDLTISNQTSTFSKGKLKKKWTERMLDETKQKECSNQSLGETKNKYQRSGLTNLSIDIKHDLYTNTDNCVRSAPEILSLTFMNHCNALNMGHLRQNELNLSKSIENKRFSNSQMELSLNQATPSSLKLKQRQSIEPTSFNASKHPKLLFQLSQSPQFSKPDHLKLEHFSEHGSSQLDQGISWTNQYRGQHRINTFTHHYHTVDDMSEKRDIKHGGMSFSFKNNLDTITTCDKRCVNNIEEKLCHSDYSVKPQQFCNQSLEAKEHFLFGNSSSTTVVKSDENFPYDKTLTTSLGNPENYLYDKGLSITAVKSECYPYDSGLSTSAIKSESFSYDSGLSATAIKSESYPNGNCLSISSMKYNEVQEKVCKAGVKNEALVALVKTEHPMDIGVMTASSLVEKVIKEWRDGCNNSKPQATFAISQIDPKEGNRQLVVYGSSPSWTEANTSPVTSSSNEGINKTTNETNHCHLSPPVTVQPNDQTDITEQSSLEPIRKSRRANRGNKYQELIKEGVIQPSRERLLAARNSEKNKDILGNSVLKERKHPSGYSLDHPNKRKPRQQRMSESKTTEKLHNACIPLLSTNGQHSRLKDEILTLECPVPTHIALLKRETPAQPVTGSQKRKARKHCITRISLLREDVSSLKS